MTVGGCRNWSFRPYSASCQSFVWNGLGRNGDDERIARNILLAGHPHSGRGCSQHHQFPRATAVRMVGQSARRKEFPFTFAIRYFRFLDWIFLLMKSGEKKNWKTSLSESQESFGADLKCWFVPNWPYRRKEVLRCNFRCDREIRRFQSWLLPQLAN